MLILAALILPIALVLEVRPDGKYVNLRGLPEFPMPETCGARMWFGVTCPGCGLTRSFICLARGDWDASLRMHRLGWLIALAVLIQIPYRSLALARGGRPWPGPWLGKLFGGTLIVLLIANWLANVVWGFP